MFINDLLVVSVLLLIFISNYPTSSILLPPFYWNQTSFRPYQDGSLVFEVRLGDVMDLICPFYDEQQSYMTSELEQYDIYRVTEEEYRNCMITSYPSDTITRRVISCNSPYEIMKYTLNFRSYLPIPNGLEFRPNQTYYFLSTSTSHSTCSKLQILVHDYHRVPSASTSRTSLHDRKPNSFPHYSHHRHNPDNQIEQPNIYRPFLHAIKAQRHSDPYSIKWITEGPHRELKNDPSDLETSVSPANMFSLALSSSSSKVSLTLILILTTTIFSHFV